jgi:cytochrome b561
MMTLFSTRRRYGAAAQTFHWLTVLLVGAAYLSSPEGGEERLHSSGMDLTRQVHETAGVLLFAIVLVRVAWRMIDPAPKGPPMAAWMRLSSGAVHLALYGLLVAIPAVGVLGAWLDGHPLTLLGAGSVGPPTTGGHELGEFFGEVHETLGNAIVLIAGLHAAAALFHHFVLRDDVLTAMLPWRRRSPGPEGAPESA